MMIFNTEIGWQKVAVLAGKLLLLIGLTGCEDLSKIDCEKYGYGYSCDFNEVAEDLNQKIAEYDKEPNADLANYYIVPRFNVLTRVYRYSEKHERRDFVSVKNVISILIKHHDWDALEKVMTQSWFVRTKIADTSMLTYLAEHYPGNEADLSILIGEFHADQNDYLNAYYRFAKAGVGNESAAIKAQSLAKKYGCDNLANIWRVITDDNNGYTREGFEHSTAPISPANLAKAQNALAKGILPTIPSDCPIWEFGERPDKTVLTKVVNEEPVLASQPTNQPTNQ